MVYCLREYDDPALRFRCDSVKTIDDIRGLLSKMYSTIKDKKAAGIAAPQLGAGLRAISVKMDDDKVKEFINPSIKDARGYQLSMEGCLSVPDVTKIKLRRNKILLAYQDFYGKWQIECYKGRESRILQHEIDHLDGRLIID